MNDDTSNQVYKVTKESLQLVLINVLIRSIFLNIKDLQDSVATHLSYDGIGYDQSLHIHCRDRWQKISKIGQHLPKSWAVK